MDGPPVDRWEYETLRVPRGPTHKESSDPEEELNELGKDGWKLTETIDYVGGGTKFLVLRRPVADARRTTDADEEVTDKTDEAGREGEGESSENNADDSDDSDDSDHSDHSDDEGKDS